MGWLKQGPLVPTNGMAPARTMLIPGSHKWDGSSKDRVPTNGMAQARTTLTTGSHKWDGSSKDHADHWFPQIGWLSKDHWFPQMGWLKQGPG
ncbi:hypothetical protein ACOMHN_067026 [Nucella lapillus]